jgi:predicted nucleic acid-binding Zn ribbon protein
VPDEGVPDEGVPDDAETVSGSPTGDAEPRGPELARAVIEAAQASRARRAGSAAPRSGGGAVRARRQRGYSGPGPDARDPQVFGAILARLVKVRGWQKPAAEARVFGAWADVVGADLAGHCRPVRLEGGELVIEAESTAWATQLRLLTPKLLARVREAVGAGVVTSLSVHGPLAPSWAKGPKRVRGRGPRDTYG